MRSRVPVSRKLRNSATRSEHTALAWENTYQRGSRACQQDRVPVSEPVVCRGTKSTIGCLYPKGTLPEGHFTRGALTKARVVKSGHGIPRQGGITSV